MSAEIHDAIATPQIGDDPNALVPDPPISINESSFFQTDCIEGRWIQVCAALFSIRVANLLPNPVKWVGSHWLVSYAQHRVSNLVVPSCLTWPGSNEKLGRKVEYDLEQRLKGLYSDPKIKASPPVSAAISLPAGLYRRLYEEIHACLFMYSAWRSDFDFDVLRDLLYAQSEERFQSENAVRQMTAKGFLTLEERPKEKCVSLPAHLKINYKEIFRPKQLRVSSIAPRSKSPGRCFTLRGIRDRMMDRVVGLEREILTLAIQGERYERKEINLKPVLITGRSGSGKTWLAKSLAAAIEIPFCRIDLSAITATGYTGVSLAEAIEGAKKSASLRGTKWVLLIDEFDKCAIKSCGGGRDIRGEDIQAELLSLLESDTPDSQQPLILLAGAFGKGQGLRSAGTRAQKPLGFAGDAGNGDRASDTISEIYKELETCGFLPELLGRIGQIICLPEITQEQVVQLIKMPNGPLAEYKKRFKELGVTLVTSKKSIQILAERTISLGLGGRGIRVLLEQFYTRECMASVKCRTKKVSLRNL